MLQSRPPHRSHTSLPLPPRSALSANFQSFFLKKAQKCGASIFLFYYCKSTVVSTGLKRNTHSRLWQTAPSAAEDRSLPPHASRLRPLPQRPALGRTVADTRAAVSMWEQRVVDGINHEHRLTLTTLPAPEEVEVANSIWSGCDDCTDDCSGDSLLTLLDIDWPDLFRCRCEFANDRKATVVYDNACNLTTFILSREPRFVDTYSMHCDSFHHGGG